MKKSSLLALGFALLASGSLHAGGTPAAPGGWTTGVFLLGLVAAAGLFAARGGKPVPRWSLTASLVLALATFLLMARTANLGGQLRHPELRGTAGAEARP